MRLLFRWPTSPTLRRPRRRTAVLQGQRPSVLLHQAHLFEDVAPICQWLCEIADGADDILITVYAEWEDRYEAEGEPRMTLDHRGRPVALILVSKDAQDVGFK